MKKRALVAALCCLSTASTTAVAAPVATAQTATAKKTMADQYQPSFGEPYSPIGITDKTVEEIHVSGIPDGTDMYVLNSDRVSEGNTKNGLLVTERGRDFWLQIFPGSYHYGKTVSNTVDLAFDYPDGSTEVVTRTFTMNIAEMHQYRPEIKNDLIEVGKNTRLEVSEIPSSATVTLLRSPEGWNVKQEGNTFTVTPPVEGNGEFVYKVAFSDETSKIITSNVWAEKDPKNANNPVRPGSNDSIPSVPSESENPVAPGDDSGAPQGWIIGPSDHGNNGGSSTAGIIAGVVGAVLAIALSIGGAAFAGLIPGLKLPF